MHDYLILILRRGYKVLLSFQCLFYSERVVGSLTPPSMLTLLHLHTPHSTSLTLSSLPRGLTLRQLQPLASASRQQLLKLHRSAHFGSPASPPPGKVPLFNSIFLDGTHAKPKDRTSTCGGTLLE